MIRLDEYTRMDLLNRAKKDDPKRFSRRTDSKEKWELWRVGMQELNLTDDLYLYFKVSDYRVSVVFQKFKPVLMKYANGKFSGNNTKVINKALQFAVKNCHILVKCECSDFKYRFAYMATKKKYGFDVNETRPSNKTNPDLKGGLCKHLIAILNQPSKWLPYVVPAIRDYLSNLEDGEE